MGVNFILRLDASSQSFYSLPFTATPSHRDGCGNNAYWVKTNLYTNLRSENFQQFLLFDHHAPVQEMVRAALTPGTCMTEQYSGGARTSRISDTVIG